MRIQRVITKQGHKVPKTSHAPRGPFPPELFINAPIVTDYAPFDDDMPIGATAQNGFTSPKMFRCNDCTVVVLEHEIPGHECEYTDGTDS